MTEAHVITAEKNNDDLENGIDERKEFIRSQEQELE